MIPQRLFLELLAEISRYSFTQSLAPELDSLAFPQGLVVALGFCWLLWVF